MKKNLKLIVQLFNNIEQEVKRFKNPSIISYYHCFFANFGPESILSNCCLNQGFLGLKRIKQFNQVHNLNDFQDYLDSIPGLYPKLVLWAIRNPLPNIIPKTIESVLVKHHAMPKFLVKYHIFKVEQIEAEYNIVKISWLIHFLMHFIRAIEYNQILDYFSLSFVISPPGLGKNKSFANPETLEINYKIREQLDNFVWPYFRSNQNFFKQENDINDPHLKYQNELDDQAMSSVLFSRRSQRNKNIKTILINKTVWRHKNDYFKKDDECFELIFDPQSIDSYSLSKFTFDFMDQAQQYHSKVLDQNFKDNFYGLKQRLTYYFKGFTGSVSSFYIVNPLDFIKPVAVVGNNRYSQNRAKQRKNQKDLLNKISFIITHQDNRIPIIDSNKMKFNTIYDVTQKCCQLEYEYLNIGNSKIIEANNRSNYRLSNYFKRILLDKNPPRKRKSRSTTGLRRNKKRSQYHHCRGWTAKLLNESIKVL